MKHTSKQGVMLCAARWAVLALSGSYDRLTDWAFFHCGCLMS